jgi:hypothetical protein
MAYLNANIPPQECYVRGEFLRNMEDGHESYYPCLLFAVASIPNSVPLFHCLLEDGGLFWRLPIHAFCSRKGSPAMELDELMLWDCFSYHISVTSLSAIKHSKMKYTSRRKNDYEGIYLFTLDWAAEEQNIVDTNFSEAAGQHKCGHFIELDNGNYAIQPNNRLRCHDPSFCVKPNENVINRKIHEHKWSVEQNWKWVTSDNDDYDYGIVDTEK